MIPTGSMAPTLMGRHKDLDCPKCGYEYQVSASDRTDSDNNVIDKAVVDSGTCPMCRYTADIHSDAKYPVVQRRPHPGGQVSLQVRRPAAVGRDRVQVSRRRHERTTSSGWWGCRARRSASSYGDLWIQASGDGAAVPDRPQEPAETAGHAPAGLRQRRGAEDHGLGLAGPLAAGLPAGERQRPMGLAPTGLSFQTDGRPTAERWLRYRHLVPSYRQWQEMVRSGDAGAGRATVRPQLISDFTAYNTAHRSPQTRPARTAEQRRAALGGRPGACDARWTCSPTPARWSSSWSRGAGGSSAASTWPRRRPRWASAGADMADFHPHGPTAVRGPGRHTIIFSNVDDELRLWVDGSVVAVRRRDDLRFLRPADARVPDARPTCARWASPPAGGRDGRAT